MEEALSNSNQTAPSPSFLANLPSRGLFSSTVLSSNLKLDSCFRSIFKHQSSAYMLPIWCRMGREIIFVSMTHHPQNILIRSLTLKKQKGDPISKDARGVAAADKKRAAERCLDSRAPSKRASSQSTSRQDGSNSRAPEKDFYSLTVERLRVLLKEKGLSPKGKKDELIARLKSVNDQV